MATSKVPIIDNNWCHCLTIEGRARAPQALGVGDDKTAPRRPRRCRDRRCRCNGRCQGPSAVMTGLFLRREEVEVRSLSGPAEGGRLGRGRRNRQQEVKPHQTERPLSRLPVSSFEDNMIALVLVITSYVASCVYLVW
jgi:hypothetical protein